MEDHPCLQFFLEPQQTFQRRYEALRALVVDGQPLSRVAERFGSKVSALKSMACRFRADCRRGVTPPFFSPTVEDAPPVKAAAPIDTVPNCRKSPTVGS